jgi:hypothetical protein
VKIFDNLKLAEENRKLRKRVRFLEDCNATQTYTVERLLKEKGALIAAEFAKDRGAPVE